MIIQVEELHARILTDNQELLSAMVETFEVPIPGARHSRAYKNGFWSGKKRFIEPDGKFRVGLLPRVLETLKKIECTPEIRKTFGEEPTPEFKTVDGWTMHSFQEEAIKMALEKKRCVIKAPTGAGKTLILAGLLKAFEGKKVLCLFNQKQLIHQTYQYLKNKAPEGVALHRQGNFQVGVCFSDGYEYADIMLCSVFSVERLIGTPMEQPDVLIVDECHEFCSGKFTTDVIAAFPTAKFRIGMTATPPKERFNLYHMEGALGQVITTVTTQELVEEKKLASALIQLIPLETSEYDHITKSYPWVYDRYIIHNAVRNNIIKQIVESIYKNNTTAKVLILVKNLEHGEILEKLIPNSEYLQGEDSLEVRNKAIKKFRSSKESKTLIGTRILQTGTNIPEITHLINARALESDIATIQALGRALRITKDVTNVKIYDFLDDVRYLTRHSTKRHNAYKREGHEIEILPVVKYADPRTVN